MGERLCAWRPKPTQVVVDLLSTMPVMYLVHRIGPTSFLVRQDGEEIKQKVSIGAVPHCTCSPRHSGKGCQELCAHVLFVMCKVLRVPPSNPLVWQLSLTDRELDEVLRCAALPEPAPAATTEHQPSHSKAAGAAGQEESSVQRRPLDEEEPCPICYETMATTDLAHMVWCRYGCGRNVHGRCMGVWAEHQTRTLGKDLSCPLCRAGWGDFKWKPPPPKRRRPEETHEQAAAATHLGTSCQACRKAPLVGSRYKCLICADCDLCEDCFQSGHHPQHPFACKATPTAFAVPAQRADMMPTAARIAAPSPAPVSLPAPTSSTAASADTAQTAQQDQVHVSQAQQSAAAAQGARVDKQRQEHGRHRHVGGRGGRGGQLQLAPMAGNPGLEILVTSYASVWDSTGGSTQGGATVPHRTEAVHGAQAMQPTAGVLGRKSGPCLPNRAKGLTPGAAAAAAALARAAAATTASAASAATAIPPLRLSGAQVAMGDLEEAISNRGVDNHQSHQCAAAQISQCQQRGGVLAPLGVVGPGIALAAAGTALDSQARVTPRAEGAAQAGVLVKRPSGETLGQLKADTVLGRPGVPRSCSATARQQHAPGKLVLEPLCVAKLTCGTNGSQVHQPVPQHQPGNPNTGLPSALHTALQRHQKFAKAMSMPPRPPHRPAPGETDDSLKEGVQGHVLVLPGHTAETGTDTCRPAQHVQQLVTGLAGVQHGKQAPLPSHSSVAGLTLGGRSLAPKLCMSPGDWQPPQAMVSELTVEMPVASQELELVRQMQDCDLTSRDSLTDTGDSLRWLTNEVEVVASPCFRIRPWSGASDAWLG